MKKQKKDATPEQDEPVVKNQAGTKAEQNDTTTEAKTNAQAAEENVADIEDLTQEVIDLKEKNLRLMAEFDNFRKRSIKEKADLIKYAGEDILKNILPLIDDFERAQEAMKVSEDVEAVKEGVDLIYSKFMAFLSESGVSPIPTENEEFNTDLHEAVTTFPAPSDDLKGKIIDCVSKGYALNEKVIRFAKVVVGE